MTDGKLWVDIVLCECVCEGREKVRGMEMEMENKMLRDRGRPWAEQKA